MSSARSEVARNVSKVILFLGFFSIAALMVGSVEAQHRVSKRYPASKNVRVELKNLWGTITVESWNRDEIKLSADLESPKANLNQVLMHFRKRGVKMEQTTDDGETPIQIVKGTENPNAMPVVDRIALDKAIAQLPPGYRTVFTLHDIEGHEHEEIARMLGCSVGTSKSQLHKARMKLRGLLRQQKAKD